MQNLISVASDGMITKNISSTECEFHHEFRERELINNWQRMEISSDNCFSLENLIQETVDYSIALALGEIFYRIFMFFASSYRAPYNQVKTKNYIDFL